MNKYRHLVQLAFFRYCSVRPDAPGAVQSILRFARLEKKLWRRYAEPEQLMLQQFKIAA